MKKGKYIDIYVIMACMSRKKRKSRLLQVDKLLDNACVDRKKTMKENVDSEFALEHLESVVS